MTRKTVAFACDHAGVELKEILKLQVQQMGYGAHDLGTDGAASVDYPDFADALAGWMKTQPDNMGVLICGSGIGMSMAANRHKHIRAALCADGLSAHLSRRHNNANVLCLGARLIGVDTAKHCLAQFLQTDFEGGRHAGRISKFS